MKCSNPVLDAHARTKLVTFRYTENGVWGSGEIISLRP